MSEITERGVAHEFAGEAMESALITAGDGARPGLIMFPTVMGITDLERGFATKLAGRGLAVLIADLYGKAHQGKPRDECFALMTERRKDRAELRQRVTDVLDTARGQPEIDSSRVAASGYCFGGQCALDLARSGADIAGAASFHGLFDPPGLPPQPIKARVIAFHGWDDPMVKPDAVVALGRELTEAGCDWQIDAYGHVGHGFTNPGASQLGIAGVDYNRAAAERSWRAFNAFLDDLFG